MGGQNLTTPGSGRNVRRVTEPVEAVKRERRLRGWSVRSAATAGGVSNTTWAAYESTGVLTDAMQRAIVRAFGWESTWADDVTAEPPAVEHDVLRMLVSEVAALREDVAAVAELLRRRPSGR